MANLPDETLMAYADGALDDNERARVEAILAADPEQQRRLEPFIVTRVALPSLFSEALTSAVPNRLIETVMNAPIGTRQALQKQPAKAEPFFSRLRAALFPDLPAFAGGFALAAAVAAIAGTGYLAGNLSQGGPGAITHTAAINSDAVAAGPLKLALETAKSNELFSQAGLNVKPILTFRDREGRYCRQYAMARTGGDGTSGFACRNNDGNWNIGFHAPDERAAVVARLPADATASENFTPADGGFSPALESAIDKTVASGGVIDGTNESRLIAEGWRVAN